MQREKAQILILKKEIKKLLDKGVLEGIFPSAAVGIVCGTGNKKREIFTYCGNATLYPEKRKLQKNNFFDLASLTKPLATTMAILSLINEKKINVDENLSSLLEKKIKGKKNKITTRNLLSHDSGLPAHREYFKRLRNSSREEKNICVENLILSEELEYNPGSRTLYSDLGFILLGRIIEKKAGCLLDQYVEEKILKPFNLEKKIFYNSLYEGKKKRNKADFVATENCPWRKKILCGEVHDDNCYAMGGVAGHSGLFGNIAGITSYAGMILDMWKDAALHPNIENEDLRMFLARQHNIPGSTWALGFDSPAIKESSSGHFLSQKSVGHLGFTGTSFWLDPEKDVAIVLLSNRVHPSRENIKIKQFRPYFHDRVMEKMFPVGKE
jgi:CubicO group peptidase (beta-lactamase class C family)